jgi:hypothetical protein
MQGLLVDNDALLLLAGAQMLDHTLQLMQMSSQSTFRLSSLPHMLAGRRLKSTYAPLVLDRTALACQSLGAWQQAIPDEILQPLIDVPDIDEGDAILLASLAQQSGLLLATGDKRALIAVATNPNLIAIRGQVAGRVVCFEAILSRLVETLGVVAVGEAFDLFPEHKSLQIHFSPAKRQNQHYCLQSLASYRRDLVKTVGDDFLYDF